MSHDRDWSGLPPTHRFHTKADCAPPVYHYNKGAADESPPFQRSVQPPSTLRTTVIQLAQQLTTLGERISELEATAKSNFRAAFDAEPPPLDDFNRLRVSDFQTIVNTEVPNGDVRDYLSRKVVRALKLIRHYRFDDKTLLAGDYLVEFTNSDNTVSAWVHVDAKTFEDGFVQA